MSQPRPGMAGATRICPHCKTTILESASICPACKHYLRFDSPGAARPTPRISPLQVEGTIRHPPDGDAWEYSMVLSIRNEFGEEINRQVVGVGALNPNEQRTFTLAVELVERRGTGPTRRNRH
ncbi:MAG: hypothetical protein ACREO8_03815 [Luteimonas sp.]